MRENGPPHKLRRVAAGAPAGEPGAFRRHRAFSPSRGLALPPGRLQELGGPWLCGAGPGTAPDCDGLVTCTLDRRGVSG
jgi:hypothetical protein